MNNFTKIYFCLIALFAMSVFAQNTQVIDDSFINANEAKTLTADTEWILDGYVYVESGAELTIEPGTVIKGKPGDINDPQGPTALVIARGGKIFAEGTKDKPIIFTAEEDNVNDPTDLDFDEKGLWGGIIILGNAVINVPDGEEPIEGIPSNETRGLYGGEDDTDNSGVMKYVSIRHGGVNIGGDNNEINGLTLGGVGSGTELDYIEVWSNLDDGIEFFGGTVGIKHALVAFCGDDSFDYDNGWRGKGQFWFTIQSDDAGGYAGEHDGGSVNDDDSPFAIPTIYNVTYIGSGMNGNNPESEVFLIRDNAGGFYRNSIFTDFAGGISIEDKGVGSSKERLDVGDLAFENNIWWDVAGNDIAAISNNESYTQDHLVNNNNSVVNPNLAGISRSTDQGLDPRPQAGSPASTNATASYPSGDDFFTSVNYHGAFEPSSGGQNWIKGWTLLDQLGFVGDLWENTTGTVVIDDSYINAGETKTLTADTEWVLDGYVYVEDGAVLNIEPGTVIKGKPGDINDPQGPTALVIAKGGKIFAEGTKDKPIIFTAEEDDVNDPSDLDFDDKGLWGGIIILGNAVINVPDGEEPIEGIPSNEIRGLYGGQDDTDNSGVMKYVSIRHGGVNIGGDNNEINGLTLGGVGSGTELDYIEVWSNLDDGIEFFGGTVGIKHALVAFCGDDSFDYDNGWRGKGQFWFTIQSDDAGGYAGEHDGGSVNDDDSPFAIPTIYNVTYIGSGMNGNNPESEVFLIRDNAGGFYRNSIFTDFAGGISIEDKGVGSSKERLDVGDLAFENNIWWDVAGNDIADISNNESYTQDHLLNNNNTIENPNLGGISRTPDMGLDPTPMATAGAVYNNPLASYPAGDNFFTEVNYHGAFAYDENWMEDWTHLDELGFLADEPASVSISQTTTQDIISAYPNPAVSNTNIEFNISQNTNISLFVSNSMGEKIVELENSFHPQGAYLSSWNVQNVAAGIYFITLETSYGSFTSKVIVE